MEKHHLASSGTWTTWGQFMTDLRDVSGKDYEVAYVSSQIESVITAPDYAELARSEETEPELKEMLVASGTSLQLKRAKMIDSKPHLYCDISTKNVRPFVTKSLRRQAFQTSHGVSHFGVKALVCLMKHRGGSSNYACPNISTLCWVRGFW